MNSYICSFNKLFKFYILSILLLINNQILAKNYEFNNLVVFGDSISDGGRLGRKSRFIAGGFDNKMYNDCLLYTSPSPRDA